MEPDEYEEEEDHPVISAWDGRNPDGDIVMSDEPGSPYLLPPLDNNYFWEFDGRSFTRVGFDDEEDGDAPDLS